jgi:uncharacterized protein
MLKRLIKIDARISESFFLWGPRQVGKSTLLKQLYPTAHSIDLLQADSFIRYSTQPQLLREELAALPVKPERIVIDEIQKIPLLLDEIHLLMERYKYSFALCGSSARKLKRGHANLLGGRALRYELTGFSAAECGSDWDLIRMLNTGYMPRHYLNPDRCETYLRSYVNDYLKEEIAAEGIVRNLPVFSEFLRIAALGDTEMLNYSTIARDVGVSSPTIKEYFTILSDTLLGKELPAYTKRPKRRTKQAPKFYFDDVGVVNQLTNRKSLEPKQAAFGKAFENWIFHELHAYSRYSGAWHDLSYWHLSSGIEVDFIVGDLELAVEAKSSSKIHGDHLKGLRELKAEYPNLKKSCIVCLEEKARMTEDGILILPYRDFVERLWGKYLV